MIDFNVEVSFSGVGLLPAEAIRLGYNAGFKALGLVIRSDQCSYHYELPKLLSITKEASLYGGIDVIVGVKFVYVPSALLFDAIVNARDLGAQIVLVEGEGGINFLSHFSTVGTNFSAIRAGVDILTCPGLLSFEDAQLASENNVAIELTARSPYSLFNGYVSRVAKKHNVCLTISCGLLQRQSFFTPDITSNIWKNVGLGAGLEKKDLDDIYAQSIVRIQRLFTKVSL